MDVRDRQTALAVHGTHAAERGTGHGGAVIGVVARDENLLVRSAHQVPIHPDEAKNCVIGVGAATAIEHHVHVLWRQSGNQFRKFNDGRMRGLEEGVVIGQLAHLRAHGLDDFLTAMADIDAPEASHAVHDAISVSVPQPHTIGF